VENKLSKALLPWSHTVKRQKETEQTVAVTIKGDWFSAPFFQFYKKIMVEAGGVEPPSESIQLRVSPYTVSVLLSTFILPETG